mgnify:FL=1
MKAPQEPRFSPKQYELIATWIERVAILLLAALVVQNIGAGTSLTEPTIVGGIVFSALTYSLALYFLQKS